MERTHSSKQSVPLCRTPRRIVFQAAWPATILDGSHVGDVHREHASVMIAPEPYGQYWRVVIGQFVFLEGCRRISFRTAIARTGAQRARSGDRRSKRGRVG